MLLLAACSPEPAPHVDHFEQAPVPRVDVLWVIDDSPSMAARPGTVEAAAQSLLDALALPGIDFRLGATPMGDGVLRGDPAVLEADTPDLVAAFLARVDPDGSGEAPREGLATAILALSTPYAETVNAGFLRGDATPVVVFVTDADDAGEGSAREVAQALPEGAEILAVVGPEDEPCEGATPGTRYGEAVEATGGARASLCDPDLSFLLPVSGLRTKFQLEHAAVPDTLAVTVTPEDGDPFDVPDGWTYLAEHAQVEFQDDAVPPRGSTLTIAYLIEG